MANNSTWKKILKARRFVQDLNDITHEIVEDFSEKELATKVPELDNVTLSQALSDFLLLGKYRTIIEPMINVSEADRKTESEKPEKAEASKDEKESKDSPETQVPDNDEPQRPEDPEIPDDIEIVEDNDDETEEESDQESIKEAESVSDEDSMDKIIESKSKNKKEEDQELSEDNLPSESDPLPTIEETDKAEKKPVVNNSGCVEPEYNFDTETQEIRDQEARKAEIRNGKKKQNPNNNPNNQNNQNKQNNRKNKKPSEQIPSAIKRKQGEQNNG